MTGVNPNNLTFRPSASARWLACPGSVQLSHGREDKTSVYAAEGTAAHYLAALCLDRSLPASHYQGCVMSYDADEERNPEGLVDIYGGGDMKRRDGVFYFDVGDDMIDAVQLYLDYCQGLEGETLIETKLDMYQVGGDIQGTADFIAYRLFESLEVVDLKFGRGVVVDPLDNPQLALYAFGALNHYLGSFGRKGEYRYDAEGDPEVVRLTIVQPRAYHPNGPIRTWEITPAELRDQWLDRFINARMAGHTQADEFVPGEHCKWCPGRIDCKALKAEATELARRDFDDQGGELHIEGVDDLAKLLQSRTRILSLLDAARDLALKLAQEGTPIPGYKLVAKRGRRVISDEDGLRKRLRSRRVRKADFITEKLAPLGKLEKLLDKETLDEFTSKPETGIELVPDEDPREELATAADDFSAEQW